MKSRFSGTLGGASESVSRCGRTGGRGIGGVEAGGRPVQRRGCNSTRTCAEPSKAGWSSSATIGSELAVPGTQPNMPLANSVRVGRLRSAPQTCTHGCAAGTMTNETPQFFPNRENQRLFSVLHRVPSANLAGVVCPPLFDEKLWSHRVLVNFARFVAARGVSVLRFDYFGDGESDGRFEDASVSTRLRDIEDAVDFCRR